MSAMLRIVRADYADPQHASDLVGLLDTYARDPAGGGQPLSEYARTHLPTQLAARATAFSVLAYDGDEAVGLVNCIEGFSTFACRPLVNIHDVIVLASHRGQGVGRLMLEKVAVLARERDACKLTLEVLAGNRPAFALYERMGFKPYQLDAAMGHAQFLQRWL
jgi:ribosomal protein S18 acetylase RimI-like enzyme